MNFPEYRLQLKTEDRTQECLQETPSSVVFGVGPRCLAFVSTRPKPSAVAAILELSVWSFLFFRSVPFLYVCWFRFGFSHKPKSMRPDGRPLFFFSRPRPNVSRLRRPGAARAQPCRTEMFNYSTTQQEVNNNYRVV